MSKHLGKASIKFLNKIYIIATASIVGPKEGEGPLSDYFDVVLEDMKAGETSWEKAESKIVKDTLELAVKKSGLNINNIDYVIAGDLLNQSTGSTFGVISLEVPFFGIYGACSNMGEGMSLGSILIDGDFAENILVGASSHFCTAERQFRFPLELGNQRPLTATWTVTGDGAVVLSQKGSKEFPHVSGITTGRIIEMGIKDQNNMGAAMAPAAVDTLLNHFKDFNRTPDYYDLIITGDLGYVGKKLVLKLMKSEGYDLSKNYSDCGIEIFDEKKQDTHSGGSGCACSAVTFSGYLYKKLLKKEINKLLFIPTGALLSPTSVLQGESIPGIAHAIVIENEV